MKANGTGVPAAGDIATINTALGNSGFNGWSAVADPNLVCVPEPGTLGLMLLASAAAMARRRRLAA